MPSATAVWEIPYAVGTDRMCDGYLYVQAMAERVDEILDEFDADLPRLQTPPMAKIMTSVPSETITTDGAEHIISYDTVNYDTANMSNLTFDPTVLTFPINGYYMQGGVFNLNSVVAQEEDLVTVSYLVGNTGTTAGRGGGSQRRGTGVLSHFGGSILKRYANAGLPGLTAEVETDYSIESIGDTMNVEPETQMYARWFADL
jgi:hypothetical protein